MKIILFALLLCQFGYGQRKIAIINSKPVSVGYKPPARNQLKSWTFGQWAELKVPSYLWSYGCTPTAAAMLFAYYDRNGYPCFYNGGINGALAPLLNSSWEKNYLNTNIVNYKNSMSASVKSYNGKVGNGHVDDFFKAIDDNTDLNNYSGDNPPHDFNDDPCVADFIGTSQSHFNNPDAYTQYFYNGDNSPSPICQDCEKVPYAEWCGNLRQRDLAYGLKLYIEACGHSAKQIYNQTLVGWSDDPLTVNTSTLGFTLDNFKAEINCKRPVIIHFEGHSVIGFGYNSFTNNIEVWDTWSACTGSEWSNIEARELAWGESITDSEGKTLRMKAVTVVQLDPYSKNKSSFVCTQEVYGPYDRLELTNATDTFTEGETVNFNANFIQGDGPACYPQRFDFTIKLYYAGGEYTYATTTLYPLTTNALTRTWTLTAPAIPNYEWNYNEDGTINGSIELSTTDQNTYINSIEKMRLWVNKKCTDVNLSNKTYTNAVETVKGCAAINATNVVVGNNSNVYFNSTTGTTLNKPFEVTTGATFLAK